MRSACANFGFPTNYFQRETNYSYLGAGIDEAAKDEVKIRVISQDIGSRMRFDFRASYK